MAEQTTLSLRSCAEKHFVVHCFARLAEVARELVGTTFFVLGNSSAILNLIFVWDNCHFDILSLICFFHVFFVDLESDFRVNKTDIVAKKPF